MTHTKIFISYSHDSKDHMVRVLDLSNRLRNDGIDCNIDQYETSPQEGWPRWMNNQIEAADFVLVVCTENYESKFKGKGETGKGFGVKWEGAIITQEIYQAGSKNTNFIPVIFSSEDSDNIPIMLRGATHYNLGTEENYESLYRHLTNQPHVQKPELGKQKPMPPRERKQEFIDVLWNVPYPRNTFFTGRESILEQVHKGLMSSKSVAISQPLAISGLGGIGKTQTAVEYAYRYCDEYKAIFWVKADSREALVLDYATIAELLNLPEKDERDQNFSVDAVKRWLKRNSGWLLIFDNADEPELIEDFLPLNPKGSILLTSRAQVFDNLGISKPVELDKMSPDEAKKFFFVRTGHTDLEPKELEAIDNIIQELDYLPLAMEQAGAYISKIKCSFQDYLSSYHERGLALLEKYPATTGKYPKSVATTWSLNFEQVIEKSPFSADLLYASAFLNHDEIPFEIISLGASELGPILSSALANVEKDRLVLDEIFEPLTQYSLIQRDSGSHTYSIHRLVQAVLKDKMDEKEQRIWSERVVKGVNCAFPEVEFSKWHLCDRLLQHALASSVLIKKWGLEFQEAATLLNKTGCYLRIRARFSEAKVFLKTSLDIREKISDPDHPDIAKSLNSLAGLYMDKGKYNDAEPLYKRALDIRERIFDSDHPDIAKSLNNLASLYETQGKYDEAEPLYKKSLDIREKVFGPDHPDVATTLNNLAGLYRNQGKYNDAELLYKRSLDIRERIFDPEHPDVASTLNNLAGLYKNQGKYDDAEPLYKRSLGIKEKILGPDHPDVAETLNNLATLYEDQGKYNEVESLYKRSLDIKESVLESEHPSVAATFNNLASLYSDQGKYDDADPLYKRSLDIKEKVLGPEHPYVAITLNNLASLYSDQGKYDDAEPLYKRSLDIEEKNLGSEHPDVAKTLNNLALFYQNRRKYSESKKLFIRAINIAENSLGDEHPYVAKYYSNYVNFLRKIKRNREAAKIEARTKTIRNKTTKK